MRAQAAAGVGRWCSEGALDVYQPIRFDVFGERSGTVLFWVLRIGLVQLNIGRKKALVLWKDDSNEKESHFLEAKALISCMRLIWWYLCSNVWNLYEFICCLLLHVPNLFSGHASSCWSAFMGQPWYWCHNTQTWLDGVLMLCIYQICACYISPYYVFQYFTIQFYII